MGAARQRWSILRKDCIGKRIDRAEVVTELFSQMTTSCMRLSTEHVRGFVEICGFDGSSAEWDKEYETLCSMFGWTATDGLDAEQFEQLLNDERSSGNCTDEEVTALFAFIDLL